METTVKKAELLVILQDNRGKHRKVFEDSLAGYRAYAQNRLEEQIKALSEGRTPEIRIVVTRPSDHTADYDRVIKMLQMEQGELFTLDEHMFAQYVMDDWRWKRDWLKFSNRYAAASTEAAYGVYEDPDD